MRIGVIRYWADRPAAEHEVIARLSAAAQARGHGIIELHPDGSRIHLAEEEVPLDFVLNLHFATPKNLDLPHVGPLWNPVRFYHHFGFVPHFANQLSHDYLASCGSEVVDSAFAPFRPQLFENGLPVLNHTVPERYIEPRLRVDRAAFYVGINWERMSGGPGRHDALLRLLDVQGASAIHGPEEMDGIRPWEGFRTYKGQLPFDGWSVVEAIADAGAALVVSSSEHYRDGVMSCRPFEAAAAGVPLISERHPFMVEHFRGAALFFDERAPHAEQAEEVVSLIARLNSDPDLAVDLATRAQALVRSRFNLDVQLDELCSWVASREVQRALPAKAKATAVVVPVRSFLLTREWISSNRSVLSRFSEVVIAPPVADPAWSECRLLIDAPVRVVVGTRSDTTWSERASCASADLEGPVCFLLAAEQLWKRYPFEVAACEDEVRVVGAVAQDDWPGRASNQRVPVLLCGDTVDWYNLPVASLAVRADYLRTLRGSFGPGVHLGVAAQVGLGRDERAPIFEPALSVLITEARIWSVDSILGEERSRDSALMAALPKPGRLPLPPSVVQQRGRPREQDRLVPADLVLPEASVRVATGFSHVEKSSGDLWWWATEPTATLHVANSSEEPRVGSLEFTLAAPPDGAPRGLSVRLPDGEVAELQILGQKVTLQLVSEPGTVATVEFVAHGEPYRAPDDERDLWWQFRSPTLYQRIHREAAKISEVTMPLASLGGLVDAKAGPGFSAPEDTDRGLLCWAVERETSLLVSNRSDSSATFWLSFRLSAPPGLVSRAMQIGVDGEVHHVGAAGYLVNLPLTVGPQSALPLSFVSEGDPCRVVGDVRDLWFAIGEVAMAIEAPDSAERPGSRRGWMPRSLRLRRSPRTSKSARDGK